MDNLDALIGSCAPRETLPEGFVSAVWEHIHARQQRQLFWRGLFLAGSLILLFACAAWFIIDLLAARTVDFVTLALSEPTMLAMHEGWMALLESIPLMSISVLLATLILNTLEIRAYLRSIHFFFPLRHAH
ncbi:hypothetical protein COU80_00455 [Candidatus Peregrinibacteria bacterium CG10_big_fil_rev_8_21_14_0_10_55_24]|nr:MAG: hypothetical protein COU80_00455 [Candidatus Peregrinibacteria bacterium CG10_big_fil_rev_8_21_14_0_10_55_24]